MRLFRPLPLVPYYVQPQYIPLGPTASAVLTVTAGADILAGAGSFTASAALARAGGNDTEAGAGSFTSPAAIAAASRNDAASLFGTLNTTPALNGLEQHDAMSAFGAMAGTAGLNYLNVPDHFAAAGFASSGPVFGELTFDPYDAVFVGGLTHPDLTPIITAGRTALTIEARSGDGATFAADDILSAQWYPASSGPSNPGALFSPAVDWYTAGQTQSGWEQNQVVVSISAAQAGLMVPSIRYALDVCRAPADDSSDIDIVATFTFVAKAPWQP
jgi:hypothetical protein